MKQVKVSCPGKLMLFGDHAVVHDRQCLVTAVDQRLTVTVQQTEQKGVVTINAPDVQLHDFSHSFNENSLNEIPKSARFVVQAIYNFAQEYEVNTGFQVMTVSEFKATFGFGSSSAVTVATLQALSVLTNQQLDKQDLFRLAYQTVLDIQGVGSGFDIAAAIWGGTLLFSTGGKEITPLPVQKLPLVVGYTGIKADTATLVKQVGTLLQNYPYLVNPIFDTIQTIVQQAKPQLMSANWNELGTLMNIHQGLLNGLGVSSAELERLIYAARQAGAYGAKLSGAGGGDCMIALTPEDRVPSVQKAITDAGGTVLMVTLSAPGVRVEETGV